MKSGYYFIVFIFLTISCTNSNSNITEYEYFENSNIVKNKTYAKSKNELKKGNFINYSYYNDGILKQRTEVENFMYNGLYCSYYSNGVIKNMRIVQNDTTDGVARWYNSQGFLTEEILYKKGIPLVIKQFCRTNYIDIETNDTIFGLLGYNINKVLQFNTNSLELESTIAFDSLMNIDIENSFFYEIVGFPDSIKANDTIDFEIHLSLYKGDPYNEDEYSSLKLILGSINDNFEVTDTISVFESSIISNIIYANYCPSNIGYKTLTGIIDIDIIDESNSPNDLFTDFTFYKQFFVYR